MVKMVEVEDMDSLDDKLFSNAFRRNPPAENSKKRITFAGLIKTLIDTFLYKLSNRTFKNLTEFS